MRIRHGVSQSALAAHEVTAVAARVLAQVILVVVLRAVPSRNGLDARGDRPGPGPGRLYARAHDLGSRLLLRALRKDRRTILGPCVVALTIESRRIVQL